MPDAGNEDTFILSPGSVFHLSRKGPKRWQSLARDDRRAADWPAWRWLPTGRAPDRDVGVMSRASAAAAPIAAVPQGGINSVNDLTR